MFGSQYSEVGEFSREIIQVRAVWVGVIPMEIILVPYYGTILFLIAKAYRTEISFRKSHLHFKNFKNRERVIPFHLLHPPHTISSISCEIFICN
jgi:hypothetical protein